MAERNITGPWDIWFYGSNDFLETDNKNEITIAQYAPVTEVGGWLKLSVVSIIADAVNFDGTGEVTGGFYNDSSSQYRTLTIETVWYSYLEEIAVRNALNKLFRYKYKYFAQDGTSQSDDDVYVERICTLDKMLEVKLLSKKTEYDKESGYYYLTLELRCPKPMTDVSVQYY